MATSCGGQRLWSHHGRTLFFQLCGLLFLCCSDELPSCGAVSIEDSDASARCRASVTASLPKVWEASLACDDFPLGTQPANISVVCPISVWCQSDEQFETYAMSSISSLDSSEPGKTHCALTSRHIVPSRWFVPTTFLRINVIAFELETPSDRNW